jgi:hypothetical protein
MTPAISLRRGAAFNQREMSSDDFTRHDLEADAPILSCVQHPNAGNEAPIKCLHCMRFLGNTPACIDSAMRNVSHCRRKMARIAVQDRFIVGASPSQSKVVA